MCCYLHIVHSVHCESIYKIFQYQQMHSVLVANDSVLLNLKFMDLCIVV